MLLHDRIAKALGVGRSGVDSETQISALVALINQLDEEHQDHIDMLQSSTDDAEFECSQLRVEQVAQLASALGAIGSLVEQLRRATTPIGYTATTQSDFFGEEE